MFLLLLTTGHSLALKALLGGTNVAVFRGQWVSVPVHSGSSKWKNGRDALRKRKEEMNGVAENEGSDCFLNLDNNRSLSSGHTAHNLSALVVAKTTLLKKEG